MFTKCNKKLIIFRKIKYCIKIQRCSNFLMNYNRFHIGLLFIINIIKHTTYTIKLSPNFWPHVQIHTFQRIITKLFTVCWRF